MTFDNLAALKFRGDVQMVELNLKDSLNSEGELTTSLTN